MTSKGNTGTPRQVPVRVLTTRTRIAALALASLLVLAACGGASSGGAASVDTSNGTPSFTAQTLDGGRLASASFKGKPTVLWFWAPWCTICRAEAPDVVKVAAQMKSKVTFVGVAGRGQVPAMRQFVQQTNTGGFTHVVDGDGSIWSAYGVAAQPAFAFIDARGNVTVSIGSLDHDTLITRLQSLVAT